MDIKQVLSQKNNIIVSVKNENDQIKEAIGDLTKGESLYNLLKRPEIKIEYLKEYIEKDYSNEVYGIVEVQVKYEGYIAKTNKEVERMLKLEEKQIPEDIDYDKVKNIASEAKQKLKDVRPLTLAQASRISGVNPVDISVLSIYLKKEYGKDKQYEYRRIY